MQEKQSKPGKGFGKLCMFMWMFLCTVVGAVIGGYTRNDVDASERWGWGAIKGLISSIVIPIGIAVLVVIGLGFKECVQTLIRKCKNSEESDALIPSSDSTYASIHQNGVAEVGTIPSTSAQETSLQLPTTSETSFSNIWANISSKEQTETSTSSTSSTPATTFQFD